MVDWLVVMKYQSAIAQAKRMLVQGLITTDDIVSIEDSLAQKYGLKFGSLCREIDLISVDYRANMVAKGGEYSAESD